MSNLSDCFLVVTSKLHEKKKECFSLREILDKISFQLAYYVAFSHLCVSTVIQL